MRVKGTKMDNIYTGKNIEIDELPMDESSCFLINSPINHSQVPLFLYPFSPSLLPPLPHLQFSFPPDSIYFGNFNNPMLRWIIQGPQPPHTHFHLSKFLVSSIAQTYAAIQFLVAISFLNKKFMNNFQFTKWTLHIWSVLTSFEMNPIKVELLQKEDRTYK